MLSTTQDNTQTTLLVLFGQRMLTYSNVFVSTRGSCVIEDGNDTRPGSEEENGTPDVLEGGASGSSSVLFGPVQSGCLINPPSQKLGASGSLTLAVWIKTSSPGDM